MEGPSVAPPYRFSNRIRRLPGLTVAIAALALFSAFAATTPALAADACAPPVTNAVACDNSLPGTPPSGWQVSGTGDSTIQGFATSMSVNLGGTISFKIKSATANYHIDILRLGYYQGNGARMIASNLAPTGPATQPACQNDSTTGLIDCGNWSASRSWTVPSTAVSGVYIAHLVRNDTGGESKIIFVVRDDSSHSNLVVQTSDATWQAYNNYGGNSLYVCTVACPAGSPAVYKGASKVSYNRPLATENASSLFSGAEYSMIRFLEANGYDASYVSGSDVASRGSSLLNHKLFISSGHDEYWSASQRSSLESARAAGVNLAFFSGNEGFWKTRWEPSTVGGTTADRTLVSYKDTHFTSRQDPVSWTGTWRDPRFTDLSEGVTPENALTGQSFVVNSGTSRITVPDAFRQLRLWRNTAAAKLSAGQSLTLAPDTLGYEWDADADNGFRPAGSFQVSSTTVSGLEVFTDYGSATRLNQTATHNMTLYRASSGALVFGAGTVQWAWGLSDWNGSNAPADKNMQQATVNLFADMGAQPATPQSGLLSASKSTDAAAPTATISSPPTTVADGAKITLSGTASDTGGGVVAGVEVSTDDGATWHPATWASSWSYTWIAHGAPAASLKVRAVDDSGNLESPGAGIPVTVTCPCSMWGPNVTPSTLDSGDTNGVEVGFKFTSDKYGSVSGLRFYKATANTGTHVGSLWTANGTRLAQATFTSESASGWQTVTFASPVVVQPNTTYVVSYYAPNGHYSVTSDYFWRGPAPGPNGGAMNDSGPLHSVRATTTAGNGLYSYGSGSTFPTSSYNAGNYWVDVIFSPTPAPGAVTGVSATRAGGTSAAVTWTAPSTGGTPTSYVVTPYVGSTAEPSTTVSAGVPTVTVKSLTTGTTYTFTVTAVNPNGSGPESAPSGPVTPTGPVSPSAPTGAAARPATSSARVTWTLPTADGDSPITSQTVTPYAGTTAVPGVQVGATATSATVTGLQNGTAYTFTVSATNAIGTGPVSAPSSAVTPQSTIFDFATPGIVDSGDTLPVELGVKFTAEYDGSITGIRFYKASTNTGTHTGSLWTATGTRLGQATFTAETDSGWQTATFATPVAAKGGTTYVASYFTAAGHYSVTSAGLTSPVDNAPLHALGNTTSPNGVYAYSATGAFPSNTYNGSNYFVDVLYALPQPDQVTNVSAAAAGRTSATISWTAPTGGGPVTSYQVTPSIGGGAQPSTTVTAPATSTTVTGLTAGTTYTFTVRAVNANGPGPASAQSNSVTASVPVAPAVPTGVQARPATSSASVTWTLPATDGDSAITGQTVTPYVGSVAKTPMQVSATATSATVPGLANGTTYTFKVTATNGVGTSAPSSPSNAITPEATIFDFASPATVDGGDSAPIEVGIKYTADFNGSATGVRFYKASTNTGTHTGSLWTTGGTRLAQATFTNETASGWQTATFTSPVVLTPGTTYIASYFAPNGHYSVTSSGLSTAIDHPPLHSVANSVSPNGVYAYSTTTAFPNGSYGASDYGVDVLFDPAPPPGAPTGVTAAAARLSATVSWSAPATGGPVTSYKLTPYIGTAAQTPRTVSSSTTSTTMSALTAGASYTFTVQASNPTGAGPESAASNAATPTAADPPTAPTGVTAQEDAGAAIVQWTPPGSDGGSAITSYTVTPYQGTTALPTTQVSGPATAARVTGLSAGTAYTFTVKATNAAGTSSESASSAGVAPRLSLFNTGTPALSDGGDPGSTVVGVKFTSDADGSVVGIRFHKAATNTGVHVGALWSAAGTLLGQGIFTNETGSGWQALSFATPVPITVNTTYVASYLAPSGHYSVSSSAFSSPFDNPPLHALSNSNSANGVYAYSSVNTFPTYSYNASNYWVDVLFAPAVTP